METDHRQVTLPAVSRWIVRAVAPADEVDQILEDLAEEASAIAALDGLDAARRWLRWQVANSAGPWISRRLRVSHRRLHTTVRTLMTLHLGLLSDLRVSARRLRKSPGFTALAVSTLAVGIGALSTVFSLAHALWLKPLPYADPERLAWVQARHQKSDSTASLTALELADFSQSRTLSGVAGFSYGAAIARVHGEPLRIAAYRVSPNLFQVLGVNPAVGRDFTADDAKPGARVVMLSHRTWMTRFGGDPRVTTQTMTLFDAPYVIAGVMPQGFSFPRGLESEVWLPNDLASSGDGQARVIQAVARLAHGRTAEEASVEVGGRARQLAVASPATNADWTGIVVPAGGTSTASSRVAFKSLLGLVGLFLLISCVNLAGLLLSRNASRRAEMAVCLSIGAPRWRLARPLLIETLLLSGAGCAGGILLALYGARLVASFMPAGTPGLDDVHVNSAVVIVATIVSLVAALLTALGPVLTVRSMKAAEALAGARTAARGTGRAQRALVTVEVALAVLLVIGAGVMVRTLTGLVGRDRGYDPHGLYALNVSLPFSNDQYRLTERRAAEFDKMLERVAAVPGVRGAAATTGFPGSALGILGAVPIAPANNGANIMAALHAASAGYFQTMAIPIKAGRGFLASDSTGAPGVAIVNEEVARSFPNGNPVGQQIPISVLGDRPTPFEIVGVAGNIKLGERVAPRVFVPLAQASPYWVDLVFRGDSGDGAARSVRDAIRAMSGDLLIENESSFRTIIANSLALERTESAFAVMIGGLATIVTGIGLYALMTFSATQRRREMGIRLALGSAPGRLFRDAMASAIRLVAVGLAIGVALAALLVRALDTTVFGLKSADAGAYGAASAFVLAVSIAAVWIPARRFMRADPVEALRAE